MSVGSERSGVAPRLCGQRIGHFTHFAFTVNFTDYVKTKPDSGFTVKSRTLMLVRAITENTLLSTIPLTP